MQLATSYVTSSNEGLRGLYVNRSAFALASALAALATSLLFSTARANPKEDWAQCLSTAGIPPAVRITRCTAALASGTDSWAANRAYYLRGQAYFDNRDFEAAAADFSQFIRSYPDNVEGYRRRAAAYLKQHKFDLAIADYTRLIEMNPQAPLAYSYYAYRADAYQDRGDLDQSIADASKTIEINPKYPLAYCVRGHAYVAKGDVEPAIADFDQAIELYPDYGAAYSGRAAAYRIKGELDLATSDYDHVVALNPEEASGYLFRSVVHWQNGSTSKSLTDLDQAARLDPKSAYTALWREVIARHNEQPSQLAVAATQLDIAKWPGPVVKLFLGRLTLEQLLEAIDDSNPRRKKGKVCEAHFFSAELALQRGSREDALRLFELVAADCPNDLLASQASKFELKSLGKNP